MQNNHPTSNLRVLALDYGRVHTGVAISDRTGTISRPLEEIGEAASPDGLRHIAGLVQSEGVGSVIVGMPVSLSGEAGGQAAETEAFLVELRRAVSVPVYPWDERFTSKIAGRRGRGAAASSHSLAAGFMLEDYLGSEAFRRRVSE